MPFMAAASANPPPQQQSQSIVLRDASSADAALLGQLHATSWQATYRGLMAASYLDHEVQAERERFWRARMTEPDDGRRLVLIAERGTEALGFVCVQAAADPQWGALLDNLHALPQYQGLGAGARMIRAAQAWARAQGDAGMHLFVFEQNLAARAFYEHQGWRQAGSAVHDVAGHALTALRYVKALRDAS
jgi:GNAT superfamily N-acetyltransferase